MVVYIVNLNDFRCVREVQSGLVEVCSADGLETHPAFQSIEFATAKQQILLLFAQMIACIDLHFRVKLCLNIFTCSRDKALSIPCAEWPVVAPTFRGSRA
jgi:hypothetical protein